MRSSVIHRVSLRTLHPFQMQLLFEGVEPFGQRSIVDALCDRQGEPGHGDAVDQEPLDRCGRIDQGVMWLTTSRYRR
jgi:hypothetical protein